MAPGKPQFLKVLFKEFMEKMPIPTKFMRRYLAAEAGLRRAMLLSPLGKFWHVDVARDGGDVYFAGGWGEFVRANRLEEENFLVFRYEGNMVFTVKVFETSGCIKDYGDDVVVGAGVGAGAAASLKPTAQRNLADGNGFGPQPTSNSHVCCAGGTHAPKLRENGERKLLCDDGGGGDDTVQRKKQRRSRRDWRGENDEEQEAEKHSEIAQEAKESAAAGSTGALPVYAKVTTPCNLRYSYMNIGKKFCMDNGLASNRLMILKDSEGRLWPVKLTLTSDQARMKTGWGHFSSHHGIRVGDLCVFHLVDQHTFNISIRRVASTPFVY